MFFRKNTKNTQHIVCSIDERIKVLNSIQPSCRCPSLIRNLHKTGSIALNLAKGSMPLHFRCLDLPLMISAFTHNHDYNHSPTHTDAPNHTRKNGYLYTHMKPKLPREIHNILYVLSCMSLDQSCQGVDAPP